MTDTTCYPNESTMKPANSARASQHAANVRTALLLAFIAVALFGGAIVSQLFAGPL
jgi:hypothetical protein